MKNLSQIVQGARETLKKGKEKIQRGIAIGSCASLGLGGLTAMGVGGCTIPPESGSQRSCEIITFNNWIDKNGDGYFTLNEITPKNEFKKGEIITIGASIDNYLVGVPVEIEAISASGEIVFNYKNIINYNNCVPMSEFPKEKQESGEYTVVVKINGIPKAMKEFKIVR